MQCSDCASCATPFRRRARPTAYEGESESASLLGGTGTVTSSSSAAESRARYVTQHAAWLGVDGPECDFVCDAIMAVEGPALFELKRAIDGMLGLHTLLYVAATARAREMILSHFWRQAEADADASAGIKSGPVVRPAHTVVLSDIDDTFHATLHDTACPPGVPYPGALAFLTELQAAPDVEAEGGLGGGTAAAAEVSKRVRTNRHDWSALHSATFLTARPACLRRQTIGALRRAGAQNAALLMGSLSHTLTHGLMATKKLETYRSFRSLYPEARVVFLGDNGQADVALARELLQLDHDMRVGLDGQCSEDSSTGKCSAHVNRLLVLIHDITPRIARDDIGHKTHRVNQDSMLLFRTYAGAAHAAWQAGALSQSSLERVTFACAEQIRTMPFTTERARQAEQTSVLKDVSVVLKDLDPEKAIRCMQAIQLM